MRTREAMTAAARIAQAHMTEGPDRPLRAGDVVSLRPRHIMTHDNTAAVMGKFRAIGVDHVFDPRQPVWPMDHDVQNRSEANLAKYAAIEAFARQQGVDFYPPGTGISHQIMMAEGYVTPGALVVGSDSHSNMYGALGALGTPVVRTDAAAIWATGEFWWQIPETIQVVLSGALRPGVSGKDVIVTLCGLYNQGEVLNAAIEFAGDGLATLSMDDRMTIANMTTEWGALVGWFPVDAVTISWLEARHRVLGARGVERFTRADVERWRTLPPQPGADAELAGRIELDLSAVSPHVSGPDTVQTMRSVEDISKDRVPVQKAYLVSCVNSRESDLDAAAAVLRGRKVAEGVKFYVAAASAEVQHTAEASGAWQSLVQAGAITLPPGCGPCIGLGEGLLEPGETGISATNRNFKGRMGSRDAKAYLASPAVVAASAAAGYIRGPLGLSALPLTYRFDRHEREPDREEVEIMKGFPRQARGRMLFVPQPNLNTDGIYGKDYTYREDMTPEAMARVVMENYDPTFAGLVRRGDILVGSWNFGTGSSREQAATALLHSGIALVIAGSFSQTYLRNAFNNGFICLACPPLVRHLESAERDAIDHGRKTIVGSEPLSVDFSTGEIRLGEHAFPFPALGSVPQRLVVAGGIEAIIRERLAVA